MDKELELLKPEIMQNISSLSQKLYDSITEEGLSMLIEIAYNVAKNDNIKDEHLVYGIALIVLDMLSQENVTNISSKKIKDVAITMGSGYGVSKWKVWYDALINGDMDGIYALRYNGFE